MLQFANPADKIKRHVCFRSPKPTQPHWLVMMDGSPKNVVQGNEVIINQRIGSGLDHLPYIGPFPH